MLIETKNLEGRALGAAVVMALGGKISYCIADDKTAMQECRDSLGIRWKNGSVTCLRCKPEELDVTWENHGHLLQSKRISVNDAFDPHGSEGSFAKPTGFAAHRLCHGGYINPPRCYGRDYLTAAMRALVLSELGATVDIPDEIAKGGV